MEYSLRAVPLGGYVAFPDDDPKSGYAPDDPGAAAAAAGIGSGVWGAAGLAAGAPAAASARQDALGALAVALPPRLGR